MSINVPAYNSNISGMEYLKMVCLEFSVELAKERIRQGEEFASLESSIIGQAQKYYDFINNT